MFPHMIKDLHQSTRHWNAAAIPGKVSTALRNHGIYFLRCSDSAEGFMWRGRRQQFLIICPSAPFPRTMSQAEFDQAMATMGNYRPAMRTRA